VAVADAREARPPQEDWPAIEKQAWRGWSRKALAFLQGAQPNYGVDDDTVSEMLCAVREIGPARLLKDEPSTMPITSWSRLALRYGGDSVLAEWQGIVALIALGFEEAASDLLQRSQSDTEIIREMRARVAPKGPVTIPKVLIVCLPERSIAADWRPMTSWACFAATAADIASLPRLRTVDYVLIETDRRAAEEVDIAVLNGITKELQGRELYAPTRTRIGILARHAVAAPREFPVIAAPPDLSNAMSRLSGSTPPA
jgi:hypothetical protein